MQHIERKSYRA